jgi:hypothetical protein
MAMESAVLARYPFLRAREVILTHQSRSCLASASCFSGRDSKKSGRVTSATSGDFWGNRIFFPSLNGLIFNFFWLFFHVAAAMAALPQGSPNWYSMAEKDDGRRP